jgi:polysaccharide biosynthesis transport protein
MDLRQYLRVLRAHWLLIVVSIVACYVGALALALTRTPTYEAHTRLLVSATGVGDDVGDAYQAALFAKERVRSYALIVSSPSVARAVISRLSLPYSVEELEGKISTSVPIDTAVLDVTVADSSAQRAKAIADAVGAEFPKYVNTLEPRRRDNRAPVEINVASEAHVPAEPTSPRPFVYVSLGLLLGVVLGLVGAVVREAIAPRSPAESEAVPMPSAGADARRDPAPQRR